MYLQEGWYLVDATGRTGKSKVMKFDLIKNILKLLIPNLRNIFKPLVPIKILCSTQFL